MIEQVRAFISHRETQLFFLLLILGIPAFLLNLDGLPLIGDEGIRSMVALEMDLLQQYIAPTLYGEYYFKKPPLWNWILLGSFKVFGYSPLSARLPTLCFLYIFCFHVYLVFTKHLNRRSGLITAAVFLTCGRILFWDSMLALIDICFSWVIFAMWVWIYEHHQSKKWLKLYLGAYTLVAIAFMLKALPALVFIALTLLAYQAVMGTFKQLFGWRHFAGIFLFFGLVGIYFLLYHRYVPLPDLLKVYLDESTQRTVIEYGIWDSVLQLFVFPVEMLYHYAPWSVGLLFVFSRKSLKHLRSHPFLFFCGITFLSNIWIYWTSPEVYARYLIMFGPLYFGIFVALYSLAGLQRHRRVYDLFLMLLVVVGLVGCFVPPFYHESASVSHIWLISMGMCVALVAGLWGLIRFKDHRLLVFCVVLLGLRIGFDLVILPLRSTTTSQATVRDDSTRIGKMFAGEPMYIYGDYEVNHDNGFYLTNERQQVIRHSHFLVPGSYMLIQGRDHPWIMSNYPAIDSIRIKEVERYFHIIKVPNAF